MPNGFLAKTQAEVALDLVDRYLQFTAEEERAKYRTAKAYLELYERAYKLILETAEKGEKPPTGFQT
jgi:outer membrane protein TolC